MYYCCVSLPPPRVSDLSRQSFRLVAPRRQLGVACVFHRPPHPVAHAWGKRSRRAPAHGHGCCLLLNRTAGLWLVLYGNRFPSPGGSWSGRGGNWEARIIRNKKKRLLAVDKISWNNAIGEAVTHLPRLQIKLFSRRHTCYSLEIVSGKQLTSKLVRYTLFALLVSNETGTRLCPNKLVVDLGRACCCIRLFCVCALHMHVYAYIGLGQDKIRVNTSWV
jgi:hypothetical protein